MGFDPNEPRDGSGRWSRMNSTSRAKLTASAQFATKTKPGKSGKLPTLGKTEPRKLPAGFGEKFEPSKHAVAIQTAKALDRDFHHAKKKAHEAAMHAALSKSNVPATKYPSKKPKR